MEGKETEERIFWSMQSSPNSRTNNALFSWATPDAKIIHLPDDYEASLFFAHECLPSCASFDRDLPGVLDQYFSRSICMKQIKYSLQLLQS